MKLRVILCLLLGGMSLTAAEAVSPTNSVQSDEGTRVSSNTGADGGGEAKTAEENDGEETSPKPQDETFERYKTITDRMPFGPEPSGFNPEAPPGTVPKGNGAAGAGDDGMDEQQRSAEEMKILSAVRVSMLNVTPSGKIAVGFTDSSRQPAGNYYLKVGESRDGWTVKEADAQALTVVLANKEGVEATLKLGETAGGDAKGAKKGMGGALSRRPGGMLAGRKPKEKEEVAPGGALANLRARRQQREANAAEEKARQAAAAAEEKKAREQAAADREQQREALMQIQEELRRQREAREQRQQEQQQEEQQSQEPPAEETSETEE